MTIEKLELVTYIIWEPRISSSFHPVVVVVDSLDLLTCLLKTNVSHHIMDEILFIFASKSRLNVGARDVWHSASQFPVTSTCIHICCQIKTKSLLNPGWLWWWKDISVFGLYMCVWIFMRTSGLTRASFIVFASCANGLCHAMDLAYIWQFFFLWLVCSLLWTTGYRFKTCIVEETPSTVCAFKMLSLDEGVESMPVFGIMHRAGLQSLVSVL